MPRHSPILQILVYFYSKQEKCHIYLCIYIYIYLKSRHQKPIYTRHYGIQRISKLEKKKKKKYFMLFKTHIHRNVILPLYLFQYCKRILRQSALNVLLFFSFFKVSVVPDFCPVSSLTICSKRIIHYFQGTQSCPEVKKFTYMYIHIYLSIVCVFVQLHVHMHTYIHT